MNTKILEHPLEATFNITPGSTDFSPISSGVGDTMDDDNYMAVPAQAVTQEYKDDAEDIDINEKIETIYDSALAAYENQVGLSEIVEPRYAARNAEVAAQYLSLALNATALKARTKNDKRKSSQFIPFNNTTNISGSNVVVADRNEILRMMAEKKKESQE